MCLSLCCCYTNFYRKFSWVSAIPAHPLPLLLALPLVFENAPRFTALLPGSFCLFILAAKLFYLVTVWRVFSLSRLGDWRECCNLQPERIHLLSWFDLLQKCGYVGKDVQLYVHESPVIQLESYSAFLWRLAVLNQFPWLRSRGPCPPAFGSSSRPLPWRYCSCTWWHHSPLPGCWLHGPILVVEGNGGKVGCSYFISSRFRKCIPFFCMS